MGRPLPAREAQWGMGIPGVQRRKIGEQQRKSRPLLLLPQGAGPARFCLHVGPDEDRGLTRQPFTKQEAQMKFIAATLATLSMLVSASRRFAEPSRLRQVVTRGLWCCLLDANSATIRSSG